MKYTVLINSINIGTCEVLNDVWDFKTSSIIFNDFKGTKSRLDDYLKRTYAEWTNTLYVRHYLPGENY